MLKAKVYLVKSGSLIEEEYKVDSWLKVTNDHPELMYADLADYKTVEKIIKSKGFSVEHIPMTITLVKDGHQVIGFDIPSALNIWKDYLCSIEEVIFHRVSKRNYGIDPYLLEMTRIDDGQI